MAILLNNPLFALNDGNGVPIISGQAFFYLTGTTTLSNVYSDNALTTPLSNPVVANSAGRFANIYLDPAVTYRLIIKDASNNTIRDIDPLNPAGNIGTAALTDGAVTTAKLASSAVTTAKLADGNVTNAKLADMAANTIKGRITSTGAPADLTYSDQAKALGLTGMEAFFTASTVPPGWLVCDGSTVSRTTYANLWAWVSAYGVIAADATDKTNNPGKYGSGNGTTTFALPDSRGVFLRSAAGAGSIDSGRANGSRQLDALKAHTHTYFSTRNDIGLGGQTVTGGTGTGSTTGSTGDTETRPINDAKLLCVRY